MPNATRQSRPALVMRAGAVVPVIVMPCVVPVLVRVAHALMMTRKTRCSISATAASGNGPTAVFANSSP
jgi:hypothetical protein